MQHIVTVRPSKSSKRFEFILPVSKDTEVFVFFNGLLQVRGADYTLVKFAPYRSIVRMKWKVKKADVIQVLN